MNKTEKCLTHEWSSASANLGATTDIPPKDQEGWHKSLIPMPKRSRPNTTALSTNRVTLPTSQQKYGAPKLCPNGRKKNTIILRFSRLPFQTLQWMSIHDLSTSALHTYTTQKPTGKQIQFGVRNKKF